MQLGVEIKKVLHEYLEQFCPRCCVRRIRSMETKAIDFIDKKIVHRTGESRKRGSLVAPAAAAAAASPRSQKPPRSSSASGEVKDVPTPLALPDTPTTHRGALEPYVARAASALVAQDVLINSVCVSRIPRNTPALGAAGTFSDLTTLHGEAESAFVVTDGVVPTSARSSFSDHGGV